MVRLIRFDRWDNPLGDLHDVLAATWTRSTDGERTLEITLLDRQEVAKGDRIVFIDSMNRAVETIVVSPEHKRAGGMVLTGLVCKGSMQELEGRFIEDRRNRGATARACLTKALEGTRWTVGDTDNPKTADLSFYHESALQAVQDICDTYGLEAYPTIVLDDAKTRIVERRVNLSVAQGRHDGVLRRFDYGHDLTEITRTIDAANVVTRLYGYGKGLQKDSGDEKGTRPIETPVEDAPEGYTRKIDFADINDGKPYVEDAQATAQWGIPGPDGTKQPSDGVFDDGECEDPELLLSETRAELERLKQPTVTYEASVLQYGRAGLDLTGVDLGDTVQIADNTFNPPLRLEGRVLEIAENLLDPTDTTVTLGHIVETLTQRQQATQQQLGQLTSNSGAWNDAAGLRNNYLDNVINRLNQVMNATGGYTYIVPGKGIMVYDRPEDQNPTMCIQIGGGYFRIADGKQSNGEWDFRTLGNGHGLYADVLYTGRITDGNSYWDLTNGQMLLQGAFQTVSDDLHSRAVFSPNTIWYNSQGDQASGSGITFNDVDREGVEDRSAVVSYLGWDANTDTPLHAIRMALSRYNNKSATLVLGTDSLNSQSGQNVAALAVQSANGSLGIELNSDTDRVYIGGKLGYWTGCGTFVFSYWENCSIGPFQSNYFDVKISAPARTGRYKPLATLDHRGGSKSSCFADTTVSDASASGWKVWVQSMPQTVVTSLPDMKWQTKDDGTVGNLQVTGGSFANMFQSGSESFYLNTMGVLI